MAIKGFDSNYFVQALFEYAQENYPAWAAGKDADDLQAAIVEWYPEAENFKAAAEAAYVDLGVPFGIAPNGYFDVAEYRLAWAKVQTQIKLVTEAQALEAYDAELAGETYNGDAYAHYLAKGAALGVNPSNDFDDSEYLQNLIDGLGIDTTVAELRALGIENDLIGLELFVDYPEFQDEYPAVPVTGDELVNVTPPAPTTVELTENTDVLSANIFNAGLVYTPGGDDRINALQDEDILTGTGELPTLNATLGNAGDNGDVIITPELNNIDIVNVAFTGSGATAVTSLDMQDADSLNSVNITRVSAGSNNAFIENIQQVLENMSLADTNANQLGAVEFSYGAGVLRGANTGFLNLDNVQVGALNIGRDTTGVAAAGVGIEGYENLTIDSSGSANAIGTLTTPMDTGVDGKIIVTGDSNLTLGRANGVMSAIGSNNAEAQVFGGGIVGPQGRLDAVDASQLEGALTLAVGNAAAAFGNVLDGSEILTTGKADTSGQVQDVTITGTVNDDTFYLQDRLEAGDVLAGGEGTDTVVVYENGNVGVMSSIENVSVQINGDALDIINLDFDQIAGATNIAVRNITYGTTAGFNNVAGDDAQNQLVNLYDLTAAQAGALGIAHSTTANNGIADTTLNATLKTNTATDIMTVSINEGVNLDPRFNFTLNNLPLNALLGQVIETLVIKDADTESNSVALANVNNYVGTIDVGTTEAAGLAGTFINFDTGARAAFGVNNVDLFNNITGLAGADGSVDGDADGDGIGQQANAFDQRGGYMLDVDGMANDFSSVGTAGAIAAANIDTAVNTTAGLTANTRYNTLNAGAAGDVRVTAQVFNAAAETSDVIARFGDITRSNGVSSQNITGGSGNDTFIFDGQGVKNSGYTSGDTVKGGTGLDTLVIDGHTAAAKADGTAGVGGNISVQKSEWDNTSGIDVLRLAGNQGVGNGGNLAIIGSDSDSTLLGYYIEIDNDFVRQADAGNNLKIISNDGDLSNNVESDLILNLRPLAQTSNVVFVGANSNGFIGVASNRLQVEDNSANGANALNGGDINVVQLYTAAQFGTTAAANAAWGAAIAGGTDGNNNVLEVFNTADVSINDLAQVKNFGKIEATNDVSTAQTLRLVLNDTVVDQMVDASHGASAAQTERLVVATNNNANVAAAVMNLNLDASAVTNKFGIDVYLDRTTTNTLSLSAGQDHVVMLGNYTAAQAAAYAEVGPGFNGANAITNAMLVGEATGVDYTGADGIAGTGDDVLTTYAGRLISNGGADILEVFGGVDFTAIPAADLAGFTIVAHSSIRLTAAQMANVTGIQFVDDGVAAVNHGLAVVDGAVNLNKVAFDSISGDTLTYTGTAAATGTATVSGTATLLDVTSAGDYTPGEGIFIYTPTVAQFVAATNNGYNPGDSVTITDTGANIAAITVADFAAYTNVDAYDATDNALTLDFARYNNVTSDRLSTDDFVTISDASANINPNIAALFDDAKVDYIDATDALPIFINTDQAAVAANWVKLADADLAQVDFAANYAGGSVFNGVGVADILNLAADTNANMDAIMSANAAAVAADGDWYFDNATDVLTYWDEAGTQKTVSLIGVATLGAVGDTLVVATMG